MRPVLFHWRGRPVWSYPTMLYLGLVVGITAGNVVANALGLDGTRVWLATVLLIPVALLGARLAYVLPHWESFRDSPRRIWRRDLGGQVMYGGLVTVPLSIPLLSLLDLGFWAFWDVAAHVMLIGMVFTRVGCLLNGCCSGRPTESRFGVVLRDRAGVVRRRIPTQLLEAGLGAAVLAVVVGLPADLPPGTTFLAALGAYGVGRALLQGLREGTWRRDGLRALSVGFAILAAAALTMSVWGT
jgi:phosphatidylglycerol:prolipoprotein diacylglycerol transferase